MRVLVTGGSGLVGHRLVRDLTEQCEVGYTVFRHSCSLDDATEYRLDVRDERRTRDVITEFSPDVVVHAAAATDVDGCETDPDFARDVNVGGTEHVVEACEAIDARVALFSTAFVFDGIKDGYDPDDEPAPVNEYGRTKLAAERAVRRGGVDELILRTDQPYGWSEAWQSDTMVEWVLDGLSTGDSLSVFDDWYNCPTYLPDLVAMARTLVTGEHRGTFHTVGSEYVSRFEWARRIAEVFGHDPDRVVPASAADAELPARRPNVRLRNEGTCSVTGIEPRSIRDALEALARGRPERSG